MKKNLLKIAGIINLFTALLHTIAGQLDLVNPLIESNLPAQAKGELVGMWHMVTLLLFATSYILLRNAFRKGDVKDRPLLQFIGYLYIFLAIPSIISSFWFALFVPQWVLLLPIGFLTLMGFKK